MLPQINWTEWFSNHPNNEDGNRNMAAVSSILEAGFSEEEKLRSLVEELRRFTLQLSTWSDVHQQKAQQTNQ